MRYITGVTAARGGISTAHALACPAVIPLETMLDFYRFRTRVEAREIGA